MLNDILQSVRRFSFPLASPEGQSQHVRFSVLLERLQQSTSDKFAERMRDLMKEKYKLTKVADAKNLSSITTRHIHFIVMKKDFCSHAIELVNFFAAIYFGHELNETIWGVLKVIIDVRRTLPSTFIKELMVCCR